MAGEIWAQESGIFKAHGLTVKLREGGPEQDAIKDLELGRAHFGVASADQVIRAVAKGADVVVLAQIFQVNPLQWIYAKDKQAIVKPQDLKGLCIGVTYGGNDEAILSALLRMYKISPDDLELKVAETIHRLDPETPVPVIRQQLAETRALVVPESPRAIGTIDARAWKQTAEILMTQGLISQEVDITSLLAGPPP